MHCPVRSTSTAIRRRRRARGSGALINALRLAHCRSSIVVQDAPGGNVQLTSTDRQRRSSIPAPRVSVAGAGSGFAGSAVDPGCQQCAYLNGTLDGTRCVQGSSAAISRCRPNPRSIDPATCRSAAFAGSFTVRLGDRRHHASMPARRSVSNQVLLVANNGSVHRQRHHRCERAERRPDRALWRRRHGAHDHRRRQYSHAPSAMRPTRAGNPL